MPSVRVRENLARLKCTSVKPNAVRQDLDSADVASGSCVGHAVGCADVVGARSGSISSQSSSSVILTLTGHVLRESRRVKRSV